MVDVMSGLDCPVEGLLRRSGRRQEGNSFSPRSGGGQFHYQWILMGEFIGTTSLGDSFFVQSSGLK
jgi:hypothetical protein